MASSLDFSSSGTTVAATTSTDIVRTEFILINVFDHMIDRFFKRGSSVRAANKIEMAAYNKWTKMLKLYYLSAYRPEEKEFGINFSYYSKRSTKWAISDWFGKIFSDGIVTWQKIIFYFDLVRRLACDKFCNVSSTTSFERLSSHVERVFDCFYRSVKGSFVEDWANRCGWQNLWLDEFESFYIEEKVVDASDCEAKNMFGRSRVVDLLDPRAYDEPLFPLKDIEEIGDDNMNLAKRCLDLYFMGGYFEWNHCAVSAAAFESLIRAVERDGERAKILPFSCWCDGAGEEAETMDDLHRHHRHFIIIYPTSDFNKNVWSEIQIPPDDRKPFDSYSYIFKKRIESSVDLVMTIGSLSKRKTRCAFSRSCSEKFNNFWIFAPLPENF